MTRSEEQSAFVRLGTIHDRLPHEHEEVVWNRFVLVEMRIIQLVVYILAT